MKAQELFVLEVVRLSDGRLDTRRLDFEYYSRSQVLLEPNILHVLRDFERRGLVESVPIDGGTGPGWRLTSEGRRASGLLDLGNAMTALGSLINQLDLLNGEDTLYARQPWNITTEAIVTEEGGEGAQAALAMGLEYLLEVSVARDVLETWSSWRGKEIPTPTEACHAIVHYATHDAYLPP